MVEPQRWKIYEDMVIYFEPHKYQLHLLVYHEAAHAVIALMIEDDPGPDSESDIEAEEEMEVEDGCDTDAVRYCDPSVLLDYIIYIEKSKNEGGGSDGWFQLVDGYRMSIHNEMLVTVAGIVANAKIRGSSFYEAWNRYEKAAIDAGVDDNDVTGARWMEERALRLNRRNPGRFVGISIDSAAAEVAERFENPGIWAAVATIAERLIPDVRLSAAKCRKLFEEHTR